VKYTRSYKFKTKWLLEDAVCRHTAGQEAMCNVTSDVFRRVCVCVCVCLCVSVCRVEKFD